VAETTLKTLIDRFRGRPEWQHDDPAVRAEAVLRLPADEAELVQALAREDPDARVRRAAVKRLSQVALLAEIAGADADGGVREEAGARLAHAALHAHDEAEGLAAAAALREPKLLASVAKAAPLAAVREAAIRALADAKTLASVVREASDARARLLALARIEDAATLVALAQNLEQKALAVAAVDRLSDPDSLAAVAARARVGAAARRARARLETGEPAVTPKLPPPASEEEEAERRAYEEARAAYERELAAAHERERLARAEREAREQGEAERRLAAQQEDDERRAAREREAQEARARDAAGREEAAARERAHLEALTSLAERAEALAERGTDATLRDTDHALREIKEALEHPGHFATRREREKLVGRLEAARRRLYPLLQQLREDAEWKRWANVSVQEELAARAEALLGEANLDRAASRLHELDLRWRQAKEAPKAQGEALWARFKAARDQVKEKVDAHLAQQAELQTENLRRKEALCEKAEALAESSDWVKTAEALRALQAEWKAIGPVPRAVSQRVWERFRKPCDRFFARFAEAREERGREWEQNLARKLALCEEVEALAGSTDWDTALARVKQLQADWRAIGPVKKSKADAVWQRFRAACDAFFDRYKNRDAHARALAQQAREGILAELEALAPEAAAPEAPADLVARVLAAQTAWRQAGSLPHDELVELDQRFDRARDRLLELYPQAFAGSELDPEQSRRRAEKLVARVEGLLAELAPPPASAAASAKDLAARLKDALATNTLGGREALEQRWHAAESELEAAQTAWKRLGPLAGAEGRALAERFAEALRRFAAERPRTPRRAYPEPARPERPRRERRDQRPRR